MKVMMMTRTSAAYVHHLLCSVAPELLPPLPPRREVEARPRRALPEGHVWKSAACISMTRREFNHSVKLWSSRSDASLRPLFGSAAGEKTNLFVTSERHHLLAALRVAFCKQAKQTNKTGSRKIALLEAKIVQRELNNIAEIYFRKWNRISKLK